MIKLRVMGYSVPDVLLLGYYFVRTKMFFGQARLIRGGFQLRNFGEFVFGVGFTAGRFNRIDVFEDAELTIGNNFRMTDFNHIGCASSVVIGDDVLVASGVYITDHDHKISTSFLPPAQTGLTIEPVKIGSRVWIGEKATILKGVDIGNDCVIAANAVVTKSVPPGCVVAGNPARILRQRYST